MSNPLLKAKCLTFILINLLICTNCFSQIRVNVYSEKKEGNFIILADNDEFCPVSIKLDLELNNFSSSNGNNKVFVIPAKTKRFELTTLEGIKKGTSASYKIKSLYNYGDSNLKNYSDYNYSLPFSKGNTFTLFQGYNGKFSHQNENSIDFKMPIGTEVLAARAGTIIKVVDNFNQNCEEKKCAEFNNYVLVYHDDGTFAKYVHLKFNGAIVKEGDVIKENDLIGYSGNVGWSNGPHLHFMVYIQRIDKIETLKTKFKINDGKVPRILKEKEECFRDY